MRTRTRLALALIGAHLALTAAAGWLAWSWVDAALRTQAETSARAVGQVLAAGGFSPDERVLARMRALAGHDFRLLDAPAPPRPGAVQVVEAGRVVEVDYRNQRHDQARTIILAAALAVAGAGTLAFAIVAWLVARAFARPLEDLSAAARRLGGDLAGSVPQVGSGEVAQLAAELEAMRRRLVDLDAANRQAERLATLGTFAATVAHEVRNPLTAVRLLLQMRDDDPDQALIAEELERLDLVVDEILSFARGMRCEMNACDLHQVATDVVRLLRRQAAHAGVGLEVAGIPNAPVQADAKRLRQLCLNLALNAIQACHGGAGALVRIEVLPDGLAVADDGPGVAPELAARLFTPFSSGQPGGTGLGLHLAQAVAQAHAARLSYEALPRGSRFVFAGLRRADAHGGTERSA